jgi:hypothetical protein
MVRTGAIVLVAFALLVLGVVAGMMSLLACSEYDTGIHSLRASICPTIASSSALPTLSLVPPVLVVLAGLVVRRRLVFGVVVGALICLDCVVITLVALAAS